MSSGEQKALSSAIDQDSGVGAAALVEDGYEPTEQPGFVTDGDALRGVSIEVWEEMHRLAAV